MAKNMGLTDRLVRVAFAILIASMYLTGQIRDMAAIVLGIIAVIVLIPCLTGRCLLYIPFKLDSRYKPN